MFALEVLVGVVVLVGVAVVASGLLDPMSEENVDRRDIGLPSGRALRSDDVPRLRFGLAFRGYRMSDVDAAMARVHDALQAAETARADRPVDAAPGTPATPVPDPVAPPPPVAPPAPVAPPDPVAPPAPVAPAAPVAPVSDPVPPPASVDPFAGPLTAPSPPHTATGPVSPSSVAWPTASEPPLPPLEPVPPPPPPPAPLEPEPVPMPEPPFVPDGSSDGAVAHDPPPVEAAEQPPADAESQALSTLERLRRGDEREP